MEVRPVAWEQLELWPDMVPPEELMYDSYRDDWCTRGFIPATSATSYRTFAW